MSTALARSGRMRSANGIERAALVLLALGESHGAAVWNQFSDQEISALAQTISRLGSVETTHLGAALTLFADELGQKAGLAGTPMATEQLITKVLPEDRAATIVAQLRRPSGPDLWERLAELDDQTLATYLDDQHDQTAALVLSRLPRPRAASILCLLPPERAVAALQRFARMADTDRNAFDALEQALAQSLIASKPSVDAAPEAHIAAIFDAVDQRQAQTLLDQWMEQEADTAARVRDLMFTFEDFRNTPPAAIQGLLRDLDRDVLALALKGASEPVRSLFLDQMSARAARMLEDQIVSRGPVRRKDVVAAQARVIALGRDLEAAGDITLRPRADADQEDMIA